MIYWLSELEFYTYYYTGQPTSNSLYFQLYISSKSSVLTYFSLSLYLDKVTLPHPALAACLELDADVVADCELESAAAISERVGW